MTTLFFPFHHQQTSTAPQQQHYYIEMKVITDGTKQLVDLLATEMIRLSSSRPFDMNSCLLHRVVTKLAK